MWLAFFAGQALTILRQGHLVASSSPQKNPIRSTFVWFKRNIIGLFLRWLMATVLWLIVVKNPQALENISLLQFIGVNVSISIPLDHGIVWLFAGVVMDLGVDFLIEKWGWLKARIPALT